MKRIGAVIGALTLALTIGASAEAQETMSARPVKFGLAAGASMPIGDLGDALGVGWHAQGVVQFGLAALPVGLRADVTYHGLTGDDNFPDLNILSGNLNAQLSMAGLVAQPYLIGGLGFYRGDYGDTPLPGGGTFDPEATTDFGINIGVGAQFNLSGFTTFLEARFHNIFGEGESAQLIPITFGIMF
jgi:opacity protein-like surface antigen